MNILLIAGHGDKDPGAVGNGYKEADLTREVVSLLKPRLKKYVNVDVADTNVNWYNRVIQQGVKFDFTRYDYVLEVHFNAAAYDFTGNGKTTGTEIYITTSEKGASVEENIVNNISKLGFKNRGVKRKNWAVINYIKKQGVSSALIEVCFIDDVDDVKLYQAKKKEIADAIVKGIVTGFNLPFDGEPEEKQTTEESPGAWSKEAFEKATAKGILDGSAPQGNVTREMLAVVLDRLGLLD